MHPTRHSRNDAVSDFVQTGHEVQHCLPLTTSLFRRRACCLHMLRIVLFPSSQPLLMEFRIRGKLLQAMRPWIGPAHSRMANHMENFA